VYGDTLSIVQKKLLKEKAPVSTAIQHLKGWGEAGKNLMKIFAADPNTRRLIQIQAIEKADHVEFVKLMNDDVAYRREMLGLPANATAPLQSASARIRDEKVAVKKVAKRREGISRLGPLSKAIGEVAAEKRKLRKAA
jgi:hypothetical protein